MKRILLLLLLLQCGPALGQRREAHPVVVTVTMEYDGDDKDRTTYNARKHLSFSDFEGRPDTRDNHMAMTFSGIFVDYTWHSLGPDVTLNIKVAPTFDGKQSWFKQEAKNAYILDHEQRHFDITAIQACRLITALKNYHFSPTNYEQEVEALRQKYAAESTAEQEQYDTETNHSINKAQQAAWDKRIDAELKEQHCY